MASKMLVNNENTLVLVYKVSFKMNNDAKFPHNFVGTIIFDKIVFPNLRNNDTQDGRQNKIYFDIFFRRLSEHLNTINIFLIVDAGKKKCKKCKNVFQLKRWI